MSAAERATADIEDLQAVAMEKARGLARAIGESAAYKAYREAHGALMADDTLRRRFHAYHAQRQEVEFARRAGSAEPAQEAALEEEWRALSAIPILHAYLEPQRELTALLGEAVTILNAEFGVDYGAVCTPRGCCG